MSNADIMTHALEIVFTGRSDREPPQTEQQVFGGLVGKDVIVAIHRKVCHNRMRAAARSVRAVEWFTESTLFGLGWFHGFAVVDHHPGHRNTVHQVRKKKKKKRIV